MFGDCLRKTMAVAFSFNLDPLGGVAGDTFVAAVLDAFPELEGEVLKCARRAEARP